LNSIIIVGILYSLVTSRAIFFQIFREGSRHRTGHTFVGWGTWIAIVFGGWVISFVIGEAIPFFSDMLSLISSLFDSWFGYIMWACAWWQMSHGKRGGIRGISETILNARTFSLLNVFPILADELIYPLPYHSHPHHWILLLWRR